MKSQPRRANEEPESRSSAIARKRALAEEFRAAWNQAGDVEASLVEWERFFRSAIEPFRAASSTDRRGFDLQTEARELVRCASDGQRAVANARACVAEKNLVGVVSYLLNMTNAVCRMLSLDADGVIKKRLKGLDLGNVVKKANAARLNELILQKYDAIMSEPNPPVKRDVLRRAFDALAEQLGSDAPSMDKIKRLIGRERSSAKRTKKGQRNR